MVSAPIITITATPSGVNKVLLRCKGQAVDEAKLHAALVPLIETLDAAIESARTVDGDEGESCAVESFDEALLCLTAATEWFAHQADTYDPVIDSIGTAHVQAARIHQGLTA